MFCGVQCSPSVPARKHLALVGESANESIGGGWPGWKGPPYRVPATTKDSLSIDL